MREIEKVFEKLKKKKINRLVFVNVNLKEHEFKRQCLKKCYIS